QKASVGELPAHRPARFVAELGLSQQAAAVLTSHPRLAEFFEGAARLHGDAVKVANFLQTEGLRDVATTGLAATFPINQEQLAETLAQVVPTTNMGKPVKEGYANVAGTTRSPRELVQERGVAQISAKADLEAICRSVLKSNPKQIKRYRSGKTALLGFFVRQ